jgi:hypothetical protein
MRRQKSNTPARRHFRGPRSAPGLHQPTLDVKPRSRNFVPAIARCLRCGATASWRHAKVGAHPGLKGCCRTFSGSSTSRGTRDLPENTRTELTKSSRRDAGRADRRLPPASSTQFSCVTSVSPGGCGLFECPPPSTRPPSQMPVPSHRAKCGNACNPSWAVRRKTRRHVRH